MTTAAPNHRTDPHPGTPPRGLPGGGAVLRRGDAARYRLDVVVGARMERLEADHQ